MKSSEVQHITSAKALLTLDITKNHVKGEDLNLGLSTKITLRDVQAKGSVSPLQMLQFREEVIMNIIYMKIH